MKSIKQIFSSLSDRTFSSRGCSFKNIVGHQDTKDILNMAIQADKACHILLKGPFGIGKTEMMLDVLNYVGKKNSHFAIGSRISKAGLGDLLIRNKNLEYLFIDEMETMSRKDQALLLSVMQHGIISETLYGKTRETKVNVRVIASCNDTRKIERALLTRCLVCHMDSYTEGEFVAVALEKCKTENISQDIAEDVARLVYNEVSEPTTRDVIKIVRLSKGDEDKIRTLIGIIRKRRRENN
jgi:Holliday junction DNA helicase RuvB